MIAIINRLVIDKFFLLYYLRAFINRRFLMKISV
nr:MAG TPA: hypothetical protein [Caudoviricetes sp.]